MPAYLKGNITLLSRRQMLQRSLAAGSALYLQTHGHNADAQANAEAKPGIAIVCGMDRYPNLRGEGSDLRMAGTHSVERMIPALKAHGFDAVHPLKNPKRQEILDALALHARPNQKLVFYFLGLGSRDEAGNDTLLCADAGDERERGSLRRDDLRRTLTKLARVNKTAVTAIIDASSGWASKYAPNSQASDRTKAFPLSYVQFKETRQQASREPVADDRLNAGFSPCFFTPASETEHAWAAAIPGEENKFAGVFTLHLSLILEHLPPEELWQTVHKQTADACQQFARQFRLERQTPRLSPAFLPVPTFEKPKEPTLNFEQLFALNFSNSTLLSLAAKPLAKAIDPRVIPIDEQFDILVTTQQPGYLVALEKTPDNFHKLHFPLDGTAESAKIRAGTLPLPTDRNSAFEPDKPGPDIFKVFFYRDEAGAQALLDMIKDLVDKSIEDSKTGAIQVKTQKNGTSDVVSADLTTATYTLDVPPEKE